MFEKVSVADTDSLDDGCNLLQQGISESETSVSAEVTELNSLLERAETIVSEESNLLESISESISQLACEQEELQMEIESLKQERCDLESEGESTDTIDAEIAEKEAELQLTNQKYDTLKELYGTAESHLESAKEIVNSVCNHLDNYKTSQFAALSSIKKEIAEIKVRVTNAKEALYSYLSTNPPAKTFEKWIHWSPDTSKPVTPQIIHDRLNISKTTLKLFSDYLYQRDGVYHDHIENYRKEFSTANGDAEKRALLIQASRGLTGEFAEKLVCHALHQLGKITTQDRTYFEDGKYTKTDLIIRDLRVPIILGKGNGRFSPVGGSVAIEIKTGKPMYIYTQKNHMSFQSGGHKSASAGIIICSKDINELDKEKQDELRTALNDSGSPIVGMLPSKDELNGIIWSTICNHKGIQ